MRRSLPAQIEYQRRVCRQYVGGGQEPMLRTILTSLERYQRALLALRQIAHINEGPDLASGEWRCQKAAWLAQAALDELRAAEDLAPLPPEEPVDVTTLRAERDEAIRQHREILTNYRNFLDRYDRAMALVELLRLRRAAVWPPALPFGETDILVSFSTPNLAAEFSRVLAADVPEKS